MKIMNVGNASYLNQKQQNFGMKLDFTSDVIQMVGAESFAKLSKKAETLKNQVTLKGSVLSNRQKEILLESQQVGVNRVVVSGKPNGENAFSSSGSTLHDKLDFAISAIDKLG